MSVYIIHNGRSYSDKRVYFVEPTPAEEHVFSELLACYAKAWPRGLPSDLLAEPPNGPGTDAWSMDYDFTRRAA